MRILYAMLLSIILFGCNNSTETKNSSTKMQPAESSKPSFDIKESKRDERLAFKKEWLDITSAMANKVGDKEAIEVANFLQKYSVLGLPELNGIRALEASKEMGWILFVTIFQEDCVKNSLWQNMYTDQKTLAAFIPKAQAIVTLKDDGFSDFSKSILLLHEGYHAFSFAKNKNIFVDVRDHYRNEIEAYNLQFRIISFLGKEKYSKLLSSETARIEKGAKTDEDGIISRVPYKQDYTKELKAIFGNNLLEGDIGLLGTSLWMKAVFDYTDKNLNEPDLQKMAFILHLYEYEKN